MSYSNPLFDIEFLYQLSTAKEREIYARITSLTWEEMPIEYIEGKVTGGSINVDGSSAVRRTCNLTLIAKDININDFYWGVKTKFKLEIGLRNKINPKYPDIIWFKQGLFVITSFSTQASTNNYSISISGKDKMCLLNGDIAGALPHTTDFGVEEYYDSTTGITTYTHIPIKRIIRESIQNFGNELARNIIINDIDDAGLELLEYRGDVPLYLFREVNSDVFTNMTLNASQPCYVDGKQTQIGNAQDIIYDDLVNLDEDSSTTSIIQLSNEVGAKQYKIAKFEYGSIPGYRLTDLTYAGDLIGDVGSTLTQMLDKIKTMLGYYEYFYDIDGKFIFQNKKNYVETNWNSSSESGDAIIANAAINTNLTFNFVGSNLISAISNTPDLLNIRNDFAVWGTKKTTSGAELDIHMRYAVDKKPYYYKTFDNKMYIADKSIYDKLCNEKYIEIKNQIMLEVLNYQPIFNSAVKYNLETPIKQENGSFSPGWWDIRDWYEYYKLLTDGEEPNGTMKWYSHNSIEGCVPIRTVANHLPLTSSYIPINDNTYVWLIIITPQGKANVQHGYGNPNNTASLRTYYESHYDENGKVVTVRSNPPIQKYFIPPYSGCNDDHTYLEFLEDDIKKDGNIVLFYNPNFPDATFDELYQDKVDNAFQEWLDSKELNYVDWREIIYQMALDYRKHYHDDDFLYFVEQNNLFENQNLYIDGKTGYEQYYIDLEGFWRLLYDMNPELNLTSINYEDVPSADILHIQYPYKKATEEDLKTVDIEKLYVIFEGKLCPFIKGACHLSKDGRYHYKTTEGKMNAGTSESTILNKLDIREIYVTNTQDFETVDGKTYYVLDGNTKKKFIVYTYETDSGESNYIRFIDACLSTYDKDKIYVRNTEYMSINDLDEEIKPFYITNNIYQEVINTYKAIDNYGQITDNTLIPEQINYYNGYYDYNIEPDTANYWSKEVSNNPEGLLFWFDFLDAANSEIVKYSVPLIGTRSKAVKDTNVKSIYYREIPTTIFQKGEEVYEHQTGYTYVQLQNTMENLFTISSKGISAKERIEEYLNDYVCQTANISITSLPVYYLTPNARIRVRDEKSKIDGEYIVTKFTIPLTHNGTMNITATKVVEDII